MIIHNYVTGGLKAQKLIAQGNALCTWVLVYSPCKGKSPKNNVSYIPTVSGSSTNLDCLVWYRSLAFPSAADLFDVQSSFNCMIISNMRLKNFIEITLEIMLLPLQGDN